MGQNRDYRQPSVHEQLLKSQEPTDSVPYGKNPGDEIVLRTKPGPPRLEGEHSGESNEIDSKLRLGLIR